MRYLGGKHRQAKTVAAEVERLRGDRVIYVEPMLGGGSVASAVASQFRHAFLSDVVPDLMLLWQAVCSGWTPPERMSRETWEELKDGEPSPLRGWAAFAASYNGKYFAGYGPTAPGRDYLAESQRGILRKSKAMRQAYFACRDYRDFEPDRSMVIYCDPPYAGTEPYGGAPEFETAEFWHTMNSWSDSGALVLVHEYQAPDGWVPVHSAARVETMNHGGPSSGARVESLFVKKN